MRSARSPFADSKAFAIAGQTVSFSIRFACTEKLMPSDVTRGRNVLRAGVRGNAACASIIAT